MINFAVLYLVGTIIVAYSLSNSDKARAYFGDTGTLLLGTAVILTNIIVNYLIN